jgi:hypothetical protein
MKVSRAVMHRDETMTAAAIQSRHLHLVRAQAAAGAAFGHAPEDLSPGPRWSGLVLGAILALASAGAAVAGTLAYAL